MYYPEKTDNVFVNLKITEINTLNDMDIHVTLYNINLIILKIIR